MSKFLVLDAFVFEKELEGDVIDHFQGTFCMAFNRPSFGHFPLPFTSKLRYIIRDLKYLRFLGLSGRVVWGAGTRGLAQSCAGRGFETHRRLVTQPSPPPGYR